MPSIGAIDEIQRTIEGLNAEAIIHRTEKCKIDLGLILNRGIFDPKQPKFKLNSSVYESHQLSGNTHQTGLHVGASAVKTNLDGSTLTRHRHDTNIRTIRLEIPGYLDLER